MAGEAMQPLPAGVASARADGEMAAGEGAVAEGEVVAAVGGVVPMVEASQRSNPVLRVADRSDSIMPVCSSSVNEPAKTRGMHFHKGASCWLAPANQFRTMLCPVQRAAALAQCMHECTSQTGWDEGSGQKRA